MNLSTSKFQALIIMNKPRKKHYFIHVNFWYNIYLSFIIVEIYCIIHCK